MSNKSQMQANNEALLQILEYAKNLPVDVDFQGGFYNAEDGLFYKDKDFIEELERNPSRLYVDFGSYEELGTVALYVWSEDQLKFIQIDGRELITPISKGGTGANTVAGARNNLGLGNTDGALPVKNGGTGANTVAGARKALGLGDTDGALPIANGGTGASTVADARNALGLGKTSGPVPVANGGTGTDTVKGIRKMLGLGETTGAVPVANGGTGATSALVAVNNLMRHLPEMNFYDASPDAVTIVHDKSRYIPDLGICFVDLRVKVPGTPYEAGEKVIVAGLPINSTCKPSETRALSVANALYKVDAAWITSEGVVTIRTAEKIAIDKTHTFSITGMYFV